MDIAIWMVNSNWWQGCGHTGTLVHCWGECEKVQPLWSIVWQFLKKVNIELLHEPAISFLGIYPREMKMYIHTKICT